MTDWGGLLEFCETDRQRLVIGLRQKGLSAREVGEQVGAHERNVMAMCKRLKDKAAKQGYSPEHDMHHTVPKGFTVKGVSTYYNDEGQPTGQWVKSQSDPQALFEQALEDFKQGLVDDVKGKAERVEKPTDFKHAASGYGSSRSMTAVLLHKTFGEHSRFKVGAEEL